MKQEWTLTAMKRAMLADLQACHTDTERQCCEAVCNIEIRTRAGELASQRRLTPGETAIAETAGWRRAP